MYPTRSVVVSTVLFGLLLAFCAPTSAQPQYCTPTYTTGCTFGDGLTRFQLNTIDQSITCPPTYQDYTAVSTQLQAGTQYTLTATAGYSSDHVRVWVDLDDNGVFDTSEIIVSDLNCLNTGVGYTADFTIPSTAVSGNHRLRFRTEWASAPWNPCGDLSYGNAADFTVNVTGGIEPIPTLTAWGVVLLVLLTAAAGFLLLRRA